MKAPTDWKSTLLHRVAEVRSGLSKSAKREGLTVRKPYLRVANKQDGFLDLSEIKEIDVPASQVARFTLKPGDVLLIEGNGNPENLGRGCVWDGQIPECVHQNHVFSVRTLPDAEILPKFLALQLQSDHGRNYLLSCAKGSTGLSTLNSAQLKEFPLLLPRVTEQRSVVAAIAAWDAAIQTTKQLVAAKKRRLAALRKKLFVRVSRPGHVRVRLASVLNETGELSDGGSPVYSVSVHKGLINQVEHLGRSFSAATTAHYNLVRPGDIVFTKSPTGDFPYGIVKQSLAKENAAVSPLYGVYRPSSSDIGALVDFFFESPVNAKNYLHRLVQKCAKNTISIKNEHFLQGEIALPESSEQIARLAQFVRESRAEIVLLEESVLALTKQKRGLMQKLLTGQWRLPVSAPQPEYGNL